MLLASTTSGSCHDSKKVLHPAAPSRSVSFFALVHHKGSDAKNGNSALPSPASLINRQDRRRIEVYVTFSLPFLSSKSTIPNRQCASGMRKSRISSCQHNGILVVKGSGWSGWRWCSTTRRITARAAPLSSWNGEVPSHMANRTHPKDHKSIPKASQDDDDVAPRITSGQA